ncbi:MAG: hypothetical protein COA93_04840 [Alphaproteobacteria bacterium]|nr:MAG: hypothetical protein COA93_04840 [Alphaproteobacteria bacterium]
MSVIRKFITSALILFALSSSAYAVTSCRPPLAPVIPDGATAPKEDILTALKTIKNDFQPAIINFQNCIATEKTAIGDVATEQQMSHWDQLFDYAYALETQVADQMNKAIRAYKARTAKETAE